MKPARIVIADDHPLVLDGLRLLLDPPHAVVAAERDGKLAVEAALRHRPDLLVFDISMPTLNGIDAARLIREEIPQVRVLFITMHADPGYAHAALELGEIGYVLKSASSREVLVAVDHVLGGQAYVSPELEDEVIQQFPNSNTHQTRTGPRLTGRERQILQLVAEGRTSKETAQLLNVSVKTVSFHRDNLKNKLGLRSTAELTKYAIEEGMI